jgi:hypothetical protein
MTDWYIDQMKRKSYESEGLPISFTRNEYLGDKLNYVAYIPKTESRWELKSLIDFVKNPKSMVGLQSGQSVHFFPTNKIRLSIDKNNIINNKTVAVKDYNKILPYIDIDIKGSAIYKNRLMMLDILVNNNWKRPIYFSGGAFDDEDYLWMKEYLQLEGMVYKLVPMKTPLPEDAGPSEMGGIDTDAMYKKVMTWDWGNSESNSIYHDTDTRRNSITYRMNLSRLMKQLIAEGNPDKAKKVIDLAMTKMPVDKFEYYSLVDPFAAGYYAVGEQQKARDLLSQLIVKYKENLIYFSHQSMAMQVDNAVDVITNIERYRNLLKVMKDGKDLAFYQENKKEFNTYVKIFERFGRKYE